MDKKTIIIITIAVLAALLIIAIGGYFWWSYKKAKADKFKNIGNTANDITESATKGVLPSLQTNPLENKPDINPADKANPFKDIKTNPF